MDCERVTGGLVRSLHGVSLLLNRHHYKFSPRKCVCSECVVVFDSKVSNLTTGCNFFLIDLSPYTLRQCGVLTSSKGVAGDRKSEVIETVKICTNEQDFRIRTITRGVYEALFRA